MFQAKEKFSIVVFLNKNINFLVKNQNIIMFDLILFH